MKQSKQWILLLAWIAGASVGCSDTEEIDPSPDPSTSCDLIHIQHELGEKASYEYTYDQDGFLTLELEKDSNGKVRREYKYYYDALGRVKSRVYFDFDETLFEYKQGGEYRYRYSEGTSYRDSSMIVTSLHAEGWDTVWSYKGYRTDELKYMYSLYYENGNCTRQILQYDHDRDGEFDSKYEWVFTYDDKPNAMASVPEVYMPRRDKNNVLTVYSVTYDREDARRSYTYNEYGYPLTGINEYDVVDVTFQYDCE